MAGCIRAMAMHLFAVDLLLKMPFAPGGEQGIAALRQIEDPLPHGREIQISPVNPLKAIEPAALLEWCATRVRGAAHRIEREGMDSQALVMREVFGGMAPEQIGDTTAAQQSRVLQHLDVLPHRGHRCCDSSGGEGGRRGRVIAGEVDPACPGVGEIVIGTAKLLCGKGLRGVGPLPGELIHRGFRATGGIRNDAPCSPAQTWGGLSSSSSTARTSLNWSRLRAVSDRRNRH